MDSLKLYQAVQQVKPAAGHDMLTLAKDLGICVEFADDYKHLLGMYFNKWHHRFIFLNSRLDEDWLPMVLAHEIGHDQLHRELAKTGLQEFELFRMNNRTEYEANAFAAHLLLDSDEVYHYVRAGEDVASISQRMHTNINLMLIKMREMVSLGYDLRLTDTADSHFFKNVRA
ncbi:ImmA/IrrE family metallo-endopeptidase [uncultured Mitsuokella sp.]|jgi:Zn-dependent peptidase ImmA (M78 family)|uniref:ImmA/IrrE family metallo-endopeptidase n=1 Tax=uncultured Mitsuokella sp. TaxID=453120 RepID=UPI0025DF4808|nr:ImmA/IrrE family metallo-endopeptidase [uncultured Mitsuokella sp.]